MQVIDLTLGHMESIRQYVCCEWKYECWQWSSDDLRCVLDSSLAVSCPHQCSKQKQHKHEKIGCQSGWTPADPTASVGADNKEVFLQRAMVVLRLE